MNDFTLTIGQYVPGDSWLYKLDPRFKLIATILLMVVIFLIPNLIAMGCALGIFVLIILLGRLPVKRFIAGLKPIIILVLFSFLLQIIYTNKGTLLVSIPMEFGIVQLSLMVIVFLVWMLSAKFIKYRILYLLLMVSLGFLILIYMRFDYGVWTKFDLTIYDLGLMNGGFFALRIIMTVILTSILTISTSTINIHNGLESVLKPLKVIKVPVAEISLMFALTLRFIPTLLLETNKVIKSQASRGIDFNEGDIINKIKQIITLLIPMFFISIKRAEELADAMESRGYIIGAQRTNYDLLQFHKKDIFGFIFLVISLTTVILLRIFL